MTIALSHRSFREECRINRRIPVPCDLPPSRSTQYHLSMKRSDFLKAIGLAGAAAVIPGARGSAKAPDQPTLPEGVDCVLIPQETRGPYPLDLSGDSTKFRQDITEGRPGMSLDLLLTFVNINDNCNPIPNARVDIWQTDKDGVYSGFNQPGANTVGQTFMRGIQMTDASGQVRFHTIYPGWYNGRVTHIHYEVYLNTIRSAVSQIAFPENITSQVYASPLYSGRGQNTSVPTNAQDSVFAGSATDLQYQMITLVANESTGGYDGSLTVGISGPVSGVRDMEPETGGQFKLRQNAPNPFRDRTTFGFSLVETSKVELLIFDLSGARVATLVDRKMESGERTVDWDGVVNGARLPSGNYVYQLTVTNSAGTFRQCKVLTLV